MEVDGEAGLFRNGGTGIAARSNKRMKRTAGGAGVQDIVDSKYADQFDLKQMQKDASSAKLIQQATTIGRVDHAPRFKFSESPFLLCLSKGHFERNTRQKLQLLKWLA